MNYDMNMIKYRKSGFFRIAAAILMICFTLLGLTACAGTTDSKDNNDDNALIQGTWEIDTGSGAGYKFVDDKFMWLKSIENVNDNYWYGDVEYYKGAEAMEIAGLTEEELKSSLPGLKPENIFVTKLDPEKIITDGEDKTATNMNDQCPSAATGVDYVHLRSLPWWDASLAGNRYNTCSSAGIGLTDHLFRLPAEVFGRERVMVRIRPYDKVMTVLPLVWNGDTETAEISAATTYDNQLRWGVITLRYR